jgi:serine/threonine-protein kinase
MRAIEQADMAGQRVAQYALLSLVGSGAMGNVYWARDEKLRRDVAIKVIKSVNRHGDTSRDGLIAEALTLSRLNHPHVAGIYDYIEEAGSEFLVMEFVPGATLREVLSGGPLPASEVQRLGGQMVRGLAAAHAARVIHRDIKPANMKVTSTGELKILDFGIAKLLPGSMPLETQVDTTSGLALVGTVPYMAPERLRGETVDVRSDIFSAGAVLYEMATGRLAFPQKQIASLIEAILHQDPPRLSAINPLVPAGLDKVVMKALRRAPEERQQSALELAQDLETLSVTEKPRRARVAEWWAALARP